MPNFNAWGGAALLGNWIGEINRAYDVEQLIADLPTSIVVTRAGVQLAAQTVRLELLSTKPAVDAGDVATTAQADVLIVGYGGHPSIADTDLKRGDRFFANGQMYEVLLTDARVDRLYAFAKVSD